MTSPRLSRPGLSRPGLSRPGLSRAVLTSWLVALACVVVAAVGLQVSEPPPGRTQNIIGIRDEPIPFADGSVTVGTVRVGQGLDDFGTISRTPGMFVTVEVTLSAEGNQTLSLGQFDLLSGDRTYGDYTSAAISVEPGFASRSTVGFEVDPQRIDDLTIQMSRTEVISGYHEQLRVHLGITATNAQDWRAAATGQVLSHDATTTWAPR